MSGMDIYTLSKLLGHISVTITERAYLDVTNSDIRKRYSKFSPIDGIYYREFIAEYFLALFDLFPQWLPFPTLPRFMCRFIIYKGFFSPVLLLR